MSESPQLNDLEQWIFGAIVDITEADFGASTEELAEEFELSMAEAKGYLGSLTKKGLVATEHHEDGQKLFYANLAGYVGICGWDTNHGLPMPTIEAITKENN